MGVSIAVGLLVGAAVYNAAKVTVPDVPQEEQGVDFHRILNPDYPLPVIYGEARTQGNIIFYDTTGDNNKYLDIVVAVCEGEIEGFTKVYMNDRAIPLYDGGGSTLASETSVNATDPLYGSIQSTGQYVVGAIDSDNLGDSVFGFEITDTSGVKAYMRTGIEFSADPDPAVSASNLEIALNASLSGVISQATWSVEYVPSKLETRVSWTMDVGGSAGNGFRVGRIFQTPPTWVQAGLSVDLYLDGVAYQVGDSAVSSGGSDTSFVSAYFYNGTSAQAANSVLTAAYPASGDFLGWTSNSKLTDIAYMYIRMEHNPDLFSGGIPKFEFVVKGRKVFDPRTSTTIYSDNPAVCFRDYLLSTRFGKGLASSALSDSAITTAANACDTLKAGLDVNSNPINYKTYRIGAIVDTDKTPRENTEYFLQCMNGALPYINGLYSLKILGVGNADASFNSDNIIGQISVASSTKKDRFNKVEISFFDQNRNFKSADAPISNTTYLTEDNNQLLETRVEAPYVNYYPQARDLAEITLNTSRAGLSAQFKTTMEALKAVPGDIVDITYSTFGWTNKEFRLENITSNVDGTCDVAVSEHDDAFYSLSTQQEQEAESTTNLIDPLEVQRPTITSIDANTDSFLVTQDGIVVPQIALTWENNDAYPQTYNIYLKKSSESNFVKIGQVDKNDSLSFTIPNVEWGVQYDVAVDVINGLGYFSTKAIGSVFVAAPSATSQYDYPDVKGLELIGEGTDEGLGNSTDFTGRDIKLQWRLSSNNAVFEFGSLDSENSGAVGGVVPFTLRNYKVKVFHPGDVNPRQTYLGTDNNFTYTLDKNIEDGDGTPSRTVTFQVTATGTVAGSGTTGESETPAIISVSNVAPSLPNNVSITAGFQTITLSYDRPVLGDWSGILVWMSTSSGFTPGASNLVYSGVDNKIVLSGLVTGTTYYIRYALTDTFVPASQTDTTSLTVSAENSITTDVAVTSSEIQSLIADKIADGDLGAVLTLGGIFVASGTDAVINGTGPSLGTYRLDLGPVAHTNDTYVIHYYNGYDDAHGSYDFGFKLTDDGSAFLKGAITITSGSGIANLSDAGSLATQDSVTYRQATAPSSPIAGDLWHNTSASTVSGVPSGSTARYNGTSWDVTTDSTSSAITNSVILSAGALEFQASSVTRLKIDGSNKSIWINDSTFGNSGIQLEYNSGAPRAYVGDGANKSFSFDGTDLVLGSDVEMLGTDFYNNTKLFYHFFFDSLTSWDTSTVGSASVTLSGENVDVAASSTGTNTARLFRQFNYSISRILNWSQSFRMKARCQFLVGDGTGTHVWFGSGNDGVSVGASVGFLVDGPAGQIKGYAHNGTSPTTVNLQAYTVGSTVNAILEIVYTSSQVEFFIDGVSKGTISSGLPSGSHPQRVVTFSAQNNNTLYTTRVFCAELIFSEQ